MTPFSEYVIVPSCNIASGAFTVATRPPVHDYTSGLHANVGAVGSRWSSPRSFASVHSLSSISANLAVPAASSSAVASAYNRLAASRPASRRPSRPRATSPSHVHAPRSHPRRRE